MSTSLVSSQVLNSITAAGKLPKLVSLTNILIDKNLASGSEGASWRSQSESSLNSRRKTFLFEGIVENQPSNIAVNPPSNQTPLSELSVIGKALITLDQVDSFSVLTIDQCIASQITGKEEVELTPNIRDGYRVQYTDLPSTATPQQLRFHFWNILFKNNTVVKDITFLIFLKRIRTRLSTYTSSSFDTTQSSKAETVNDSEVSYITATESKGQLDAILLLAFPMEIGSAIKNSAFEAKVRQISNTAYASGVFPGSAEIARSINSMLILSRTSFDRIFSSVNPALYNIDKENIRTIILKMQEAGVFDLAAYAYEIGEFAKKRFRNKFQTAKSAADIVDPNVDLRWIILLGNVKDKLKGDPLTFAAINYYFPSFGKFFVSALAAVGDYSNNGLGGGEEDSLNDPEKLLDSLAKAFGANSNGEPFFKFAFEIDNTAKKIKEVIDRSPFRANVAPSNPDIFHLRLGAANFYVPPITIDVNTSFKTGSLTGAAIRQKNSPKFNSGYKETSIRLRLFFPNYEEIWGISIDDASKIDLNESFKIDFKNGGDSELKIDKFLSSLRGLIAAFKYSPFLPVKNDYLNRVHGITGVALNTMSISTVPNFPFAVAVDIELLNFNHQPFLPMIKDFNQAIHWGKYRQYMGKAAGQLHRYVNEEFLLKESDIKTGLSVPKTEDRYQFGSPDAWERWAEKNKGKAILEEEQEVSDASSDLLSINIINEWTNGNHITLFAPAETQTKIFLPDTSSFRSEEEKIMPDLSENLWQRVLAKIGIDINASASYGIPLSQTIDASREQTYSTSTRKIIEYSIDILTAGINSSDSTEQMYDYLVESFIVENKTNNILNSQTQEWLRDYQSLGSGSGNTQTKSDWKFQGQQIYGVSLEAIKIRLKQIAANPKVLLDFLVENKIEGMRRTTGLEPDAEKVKQEVSQAFSVTVYERFFKSGPIQQLMESARLRAGYYQFNEWEVPMLRVDLDPKSVIVNGINVALRNSFAKMQVQMHDEPTYQHIGGGDSLITISMTIVGEKELIKLKNLFNHVSGLARLEHSTGVIGFLGIKNVLTALSGIKYVLPLNYSVNTKPNYPHVYDVQLSLVDFDILQQKRENISSEQQKKLVEHFQTKKNPFLRIKQMWGAFNAYPDFPLDLKNVEGDTVGHLDPDFYFRSFEMFDQDVVNSFSHQEERIQNYTFSDSGTVGIGDLGKYAEITNRVLEFFRLYSSAKSPETVRQGDIGYITKTKVIEQMKEYMYSQDLSKEEFIKIIQQVSISETSYDNVAKAQLLTDFIEISSSANEIDPFGEEINPAPFKQGDISPNQMSQIISIQAALEGKYSLPSEKHVSFHPDDVDFHRQIFLVPANSKEDVQSNRINAFMQTAVGTHYGYVDKISGRFYLTVNGYNVVKSNTDGKYKFTSNFVRDTQIPELGNTNPNTGVAGVVALSEYQNAYSGDTYKHWEKMMVDTSYRDISGRMLRAFPTYMLWLIDEGGYFAGVKLFDNFYGLQSIIDFSVVSSEDLLGDTFVFRLSNLYNKLTTPDASQIFNPNIDEFQEEDISLDQGLSSLVNRALNFSRNILSGMRNEYIVDINNIRLKPGVRVHLRAGYGSNPNSLQTLFNGIITNVEPGEIITVTAQSDAIELGAVINSTNKKGDSGKIDGGIDTGMYLSEPRDLMVRLLSMGSSRTRESLARATRGTIFSENRFGIRHFGMIMYEPLTPGEKQKSDAIRDSIAAAFTISGSNNSIPNKVVGITEGFSFNYRGNTLGAISQLFANFGAQTDLEIFKRNIYPGNGTGIAQFLGGDLDDGWSTAASLTSEDSYNERLDGYLGRLTDYSWNTLIKNAESQSVSSSVALDELVFNNKLQSAEGRAGLVKGSLGIALTGLAAVAAPVAGGVVGLGLLGILRGRGGTNFFRMMGLVSPNADDDLSGFDEVSFRAQTYMRTVWDLFQTCARLLPNYIVAVRPFEDRSTVFYGKPHWLYTSGVVPVTTGFPGEEEAQRLGIIPPKQRIADAELTSVLDVINKTTNPYADYSAFFAAAEPNQDIMQTSQDMMQSSGVYAPTSSVKGKVLDFYSQPAKAYINSGTKEVMAMMPKTKGKVYLGTHLPVGKNVTEDYIENQLGIHKQLSNLPPRYQFPYFSTTEKTVLQSSTTVTRNYTLQSGLINPLKLVQGKQRDLLEGNILIHLKLLEFKFFEETKQTLSPSEGLDGTGLVLDRPINLYELNSQALSIPFEGTIVRMPIPSLNLTNLAEVDQKHSFEYEPAGSGGLSLYEEWGSPETAEDEQFYIAMKWPYNPNTTNPLYIEAFKKRYNLDKLYGSFKDYKARKVLVYNPSNNRAVVCKPAYFLWGDEPGIDAVVSPDAAYFLGIITETGIDNPFESEGSVGILEYDTSDSGFRFVPKEQECYMAFVPDYVPVGAIAPTLASPTSFSLKNANSEFIDKNNQYLIGFGTFQPQSGDKNFAAPRQYATEIIGSADSLERKVAEGTLAFNNSLNILKLYQTEYVSSLDNLTYGGNPLKTAGDQTYFQAVIKGQYEELERDNLYMILDLEVKTTGFSDVNTGRYSFAPIYDPADLISVEARSFYDENYDPSVSVIAGNGRTLRQAQDIWDQFRFGYHTYESVKQIFFQTFGLDPDNEEEFPPFYKNIISPTASTTEGLLEPFRQGTSTTAVDEFAILLGSEYINQLSTTTNGSGLQYSYNSSRKNFEEAIEFARRNYIDAPLDEGGLVEYFNTIIVKSLKSIRENFFSDSVISNVLEFSLDADVAKNVSAGLGKSIKTPKQLFLFVVGVFRQRMWEDSYARAWLVLKPDRKKTGQDQWSFRPVDKIFRAFIDPYSDYAKPSNKEKFRKLLVSTRGEGNSDTNIISEVVNGIDNFWDTNVGPIFTAIGDGLAGLMAMFRLSMQQTGYALSEVGNFKKQANILNKALNDSIYYSLGRPGSILRAVDNPFTREYGEPVVEVREPFQRMHYISSFSHILSNRIQENLNNVATVVTAVSDGKYPVTVALDKGAPAERQTEKTIETGIYFDNMVGSGFLGVLHPLMHPLETFRGVAKNIQGAPDELSARRIALAHLKESIKDIYSGEVIVIGNGDIRPHDLVYIADIYERMYGIFEVEQVVHHFTPDLGYITAITPNALVTVNDPARWFMTSWMHSWFNVQVVRNDARMYLDRIRTGNSGITTGGNISLDALAEALNRQMIGGIQFTHGSSALVKDMMANQTAQDLDSGVKGLVNQAGISAGATGSLTTLIMGGIAQSIPIVGQLAWNGWKWVRDNLLDQHGCYVQYLNKNGQPMDAGLSYSQGMVVGQHHSKNLLPGILGVRQKTRTTEGYSYVRSDDLFKSLGWRETEIKDLVRYISYENALVHGRVLQLAGLGPEKAGLERQFRVICRLSSSENAVKDGDTIEVEDIISGAVFTVRFDGMNTGETNPIGAKVGYPETLSDSELTALDLSSPGGRAKMFTKAALRNKLFIVRINPTREYSVSVLDEDFEAGSKVNAENYYAKDVFDRTLGTIWYYLPRQSVESHKSFVNNLARSYIDMNLVIEKFKDSLYDKSVFKLKFSDIYSKINDTILTNIYDQSDYSTNDVLYNFSEEERKKYTNLVYFKIIEEIYEISSQWPQISWDEYHSDGIPYTLNWELVVNNLARVYIKDLQTESKSVQDSYDMTPMPK